MAEWITLVLDKLSGLIGGLFGGKGTSQIGNRNVSVTTGDNAGGVQVGDFHEYHLNMPISQPPSPFVKLEKQMPDLLEKMRDTLKSHPLIRDVIVLQSPTTSYGWLQDHLRFSPVDEKEIHAKMKILENNGLVSCENSDPFFTVYRLSEDLTDYLTDANATARSRQLPHSPHDASPPT